MKQEKLFTILMLLFLGMMAISFTACSSSDNEEDDGSQRYKRQIIGTWYSDRVSYVFESDGTGWCNSDSWDVIANFKYTIEGQGVQMHQFTYVNTTTGSLWYGEDQSAHSTKSVAKLTKYQRYAVEKERNVPYSTQLASECLQLGVK